MIITKTPLRISFVGGGTDLPDYYYTYDGAVVSATIDKFFYVIIKGRYDDDIYINYSKKEIVHSIDDIEHELIREAMRKTGVTKGVEITTLSDIPSEGSGLGSSSAVLVGMLNALYVYKGIQQNAGVLAREAAEIEIDVLKKPIGLQDQYATAFGGLNHIRFLRSGVVEVEPVRTTGRVMRDLFERLLFFYTGVTRKSSTILSLQQNEIKSHLEVMHAMKEQTKILVRALSEGNVDIIGSLLHEGWMMKRSLSSAISNETIDLMYEVARSAGAIGGKIVGAGGGGFLLLYVPHGNQTAVRNALSGYRELPIHFEQDGSKVIFNIKSNSNLWI